MGSLRRAGRVAARRGRGVAYALCVALLVGLGFSCQGDGRSYVRITTEFGEMRVLLYDSTPVHRDNFLKLVEAGFYDSLLFHRVVPGFMIQGGDPDSRGAAPQVPLGEGGPGYTLPAEIGAPHLRGVLAAARFGDPVNPDKRSNGSQFFIVAGQPITDDMLDQMLANYGATVTDEERARYRKDGGAPQLDGGYTAFGEVVEGRYVIDKIAAVDRDRLDRPREDVYMRITID